MKQLMRANIVGFIFFLAALPSVYGLRLTDVNATIIPKEVRILMKYYPQIVGFENNRLLFKDGTALLYDDGKQKSNKELLENPDVQDQFYYHYPKGKLNTRTDCQQDAGRIRNEEFFRKIYGKTKAEVAKNLVQIVWCPKLVGQKIRVTSMNGVADALRKVSAELDEMPEYKVYLQNCGGTFNWRVINGTRRLSMHSFGMTIDLNAHFSDYWQWSCHCTNEDKAVTYKNRIPQKIVDVFEKHGFIWGGKWYHYDTMHFEYRPELLDN